MEDDRSARQPASAPATPAPAPPARAGLRFGVEVEHQGLNFAQVTRVLREKIAGSSAEHNRSIHAPDGRTWRLDADGGGVEVVTPVLQGSEDLALLQCIVAGLRQAGGKADKRAGLHVHVDAANFTPKEVQTLIGLMTRHEHWLYPVWGVHAERRNMWCQSIDPHTARSCTQKVMSMHELACAWGRSRYLGLNLQNYLSETRGKNTIEFRYLNGTLDPVAIGCAVGFYMAVAQTALDGRVPMVAPESRSSLPHLLRELQLHGEHPVAVHLRGQLQERVAQGWDTASLGPLPDLAQLVDDDEFVAQVCVLLGADDTAEDVARAAHLVTRSLPEILGRAWRHAVTLMDRVQQDLSSTLDMAAAMRLVQAYQVRDDDLVACLKIIHCHQWGSARIERAASVMLPCMPDPVHLYNALNVVRMVTVHDVDKRIDAVHERLILAPDDLQALYDVLQALPPTAARTLGRRIEACQSRGHDIRALGAKLAELGNLVRECPDSCFEFLPKHADIDLRTVASIAKMHPMAGWILSERLEAAACLASWADNATDLESITDILAWVTRDAGAESLPLVRGLVALTPAQLSNLHVALTMLNPPMLCHVAPDALKWIQDGGDVLKLCAAVNILRCYTRGQRNTFMHFADAHDRAALRRFATRLRDYGLPPMNDWQRFLGVQEVARYEHDPEELAARLCICAAATTRTERDALLAMRERYAEFAPQFLLDGLEGLKSGRYDRVPGRMSTRDEGHVLFILSRRVHFDSSFSAAGLKELGLPSWQRVEEADRHMLALITANAGSAEISEALANHPNPFGFRGVHTMAHQAMRVAAASPFKPAGALGAFAFEMHRLGVDLSQEDPFSGDHWTLIVNRYMSRAMHPAIGERRPRRVLMGGEREFFVPGA